MFVVFPSSRSRRENSLLDKGKVAELVYQQFGFYGFGCENVGKAEFFKENYSVL